MTETPLSARRGDTFKLAVSYLDSDDQPVDVTGHEATFTVWEDETVVTKVSTVMSSSGGIEADTDGYVVRVDEAVTNTWPDHMWYELRERDTAGDVSTLLEGPFRLTAAIRSGEFSV